MCPERRGVRCKSGQKVGDDESEVLPLFGDTSEFTCLPLSRWYRVQVKEIPDGESVRIYELDYGKTKVVHSSVFQPLIMEFRQLPFQAVVAQLAGMRGFIPATFSSLFTPKLPPTGVTQWSHEASMLFRKHVEHRPLVAKVESLSDVEGYLWNCRLSVYLVDTSLEDKDIWIHSLMADISAEPSRA